MTRLRLGAALVSLWAGVNLLLALGIVAAMVVLGRSPPSLLLYVTEAERAATPAASLALIHALAVLFNGCAAAFCALVLAAIWKGLVARVRWVFVPVCSTTAFVQACGFASDAYLGHRNLAANVASTLVLAAGLALCATARDSP